IPLTDLPAIILPGNLSPIQFFIEAHRDNSLRENYDRVELARNILHVREALGCSQAEAGRQLGIDNASEVTKLLRVLRLPEDVLEKIGDGDGRLPFTSAYALSRLSDETTIRDLADKATRGLLCRDKLEETVIRILGGRKQRREKPIRVRTPGGLLAMIPPL